MSATAIRPSRLIGLFIILHLIIWTLTPFLIRYNLPMDSIEGAIWGHQLDWGYDKDPFLNGWLTALTIYIDHYSGWAIYLFSQLSVALCLGFVWKTARQMLAPIPALISVLILEGVQYFNFHSIDFNDNNLELSLWASISYFFYLALRDERRKDWLLVGVLAGFGIMAKYYTLALLASMGLCLLIHAPYRRQLSTIKPYLAALICIAIILPHTLWLFSHDFVTITYVLERTKSDASWFNHLYFPAQFFYEQAQVFLPSLIIFLLFFGREMRFNAYKMLPPLTQHFILYVAFGPFLLTLLLSIILGITLRAGWGMPLQSFWGLALAASLPNTATFMQLKRFLITLFSLVFFFAGAYAVSLTATKNSSSANFPGRELASVVTKAWHDQYQTPLPYVAGWRWLGGNVAYYSKDHPAVFMEWNKRRTTWLDEATLRRDGAVFLWYLNEYPTTPPELLTAYPNLGPAKTIALPWHRSKLHSTPLRLGMAVLPPEKSRG